LGKAACEDERCQVRSSRQDGHIRADRCGFQTGVGTVLNLLTPGKDDSIVMFGLGSVGGQTALMVAKHLVASQIIAVNVVQFLWENGKSLGLHTFSSRKQTNVVEANKKQYKK
jgi:Zn-dependent alcohol dehydrogenase